MKNFAGDRKLCGFELNLWRLHQRVLHQFNVFCIFRWRRVNVADQQRELIQWFVPGNAPGCEAVAEFLREELKRFESEDTPSEDPGIPTIPGCDVEVNVELFGGVQPYLECSQLQGVLENAMTSLKAKGFSVTEQGDEDATE